MERTPKKLNDEPSSREWEELRRVWLAQADRPPRLAPPDAARQVLARLDHESSSRHRPAMLWTAAAAAVAALAVGWWLQPTEPQHIAAHAPAASAAVPVPLDEGVVLLWLDAETPLYLTLEPRSLETPKGVS